MAKPGLGIARYHGKDAPPSRKGPTPASPPGSQPLPLLPLPPPPAAPGVGAEPESVGKGAGFQLNIHQAVLESK